MMILQVYCNLFQSMNYDKTNTAQDLNTKWYVWPRSLPGGECGHSLPSVEKQVLIGPCTLWHRNPMFFLSVVNSCVRWAILWVCTVAAPLSMSAPFLSLESDTAITTTATTLTHKWLQWMKRDKQLNFFLLHSFFFLGPASHSYQTNVDNEINMVCQKCGAGKKQYVIHTQQNDYE